MPSFFFRYTDSLRVKLIVPFLAGTLALTASLVWYTYTSAREEMVSAMLSISEAKTNHAVSSMSLIFKSMFTALHNMVADPHVLALMATQHPPKDARQKALEWVDIVSGSNDYYRDIMIVDKAGVCIVSSNPSHIGQSYLADPIVQKALRGQFNMGNCSVGRVTKKFSVTMAGPVDIDDDVAGALLIINDFPNIVDYGQNSSYDSQTIFTAFLTGDGLFAAHKDKELMGSKTARFPGLYTQLSAVRDHGGAVEYTLNGEEWLGFCKIEPYTRWLVVTSGKQDEVLASAYKMGLTVSAISLLFVAIITFLVVRFATGVLNSLLSLITYAKAVSEGDLERTLEATQRHDELGTLHKALQRLVITLKGLVVEARTASEMKGQFLANMSHEIRTPLNAIIGMTHLMRREPNLPEQLRIFVDKILTSSRLLLGLINDILDLSKVEAGMIELEHTPFDLYEIVNNAVSIHQDGAATKGIGLELDYSTALPKRVVGDPLRLGQVLSNLLSNAVKFTAEGRILVRCACEPEKKLQSLGIDSPAGNTPASQWVRICVMDSGVGISVAAREKLFQPFTQADSSITRQFGGTGLGLTISSKLVSLMGGTLELQGKEGQGTTATFTMLLEVAAENKSNAVEQDDSENSPLQLNGKKVLVAEDNPINQLVMRELLVHMGAQVIMTSNGQEAVEAVERESFDLILMDMQMPIMGGLEATHRIRVLPCGGNVPIIALTANAMKEDRAKCLASGMNAYLTKPIEPTVLSATLRKWLK